MTFSVLLYVTRKPTLTPAEFKAYWENTHIPLLMSIFGSDWPMSHTRRYIARTEGDGNNWPATVLLGKQEDFPYDGIAEMTFADEKAFQAFFGIYSQPDIATKIAEDEEKFLVRDKLTAVVVGETTRTSNP